MVISPTQTHTWSWIKRRIIIIGFFLLNSWNLNILPHPGYDRTPWELSFFRNVLSHTSTAAVTSGKGSAVLEAYLMSSVTPTPSTWKTWVSNSVNKARHKKRKKNERYIINVWFTAHQIKLQSQFHYFNFPRTQSLFLWLEAKKTVEFQENLCTFSCHTSLQSDKYIGRTYSLILLKNGQKKLFKTDCWP